jgi:hypothetical protein
MLAATAQGLISFDGSFGFGTTSGIARVDKTYLKHIGE